MRDTYGEKRERNRKRQEKLLWRRFLTSRQFLCVGRFRSALNPAKSGLENRPELDR
jgi:hypothetical protein